MFVDLTHRTAPPALSKSCDQAGLQGSEFTAGSKGRIKGHWRNEGEKSGRREKKQGEDTLMCEK